MQGDPSVSLASVVTNSLSNADVLTVTAGGEGERRVKPESFEPLPDPPTSVSGAILSIRHATFVEAQICLGYAAILLLAVGAGEAAADLANWWVGICFPLTDGVLVLVPVPNASIARPFEIALYRNILAATILLTATIFLVLRRRWPHWRRHAGLIIKLMPRRRETPHELAQAGYFQLALGSAATVMLMLYGDQRLGSFTETLYAQSWTFLRAPLLAVLAFALACHALALRSECLKEARELKQDRP